MSSLNDLRGRLDNATRLHASWSENSVTVAPRSGTGFPVTLNFADYDLLLVEAEEGRCHWHLESWQEAIERFFLLLCDQCRMRVVTSKGNRLHRMSFEVHKDGEWDILSEAVMVWRPFWRKRQVTYVNQNGCWISPDRMHVVIVSPDSGFTYCFNMDASHMCFSYKLPGIWRPSSQPGLLESEDASGRVGIVLFSSEELNQQEGVDAVTQAAHLVMKSHDEMFETKIHSKLTPFPASRPGAMKWTATFSILYEGDETKIGVEKFFVEIASGWVAQITAQPVGSDAVVLAALEELSISSEQEDLWQLVREMCPNLE
jgi:hypothetical protein